MTRHPPHLTHMEATHDTMIALYTKVLVVLALFVAVTLICNLARRVARYYIGAALGTVPASSSVPVSKTACLPRVSLRRHVQALIDVVAHNANPIVIAEHKFGVELWPSYIWTPEANFGAYALLFSTRAPEHRSALCAEPAFDDAHRAISRDRNFRTTGIPTAEILLPLATPLAG